MGECGNGEMKNEKLKIKKKLIKILRINAKKKVKTAIYCLRQSILFITLFFVSILKSFYLNFLNFVLNDFLLSLH